VCVSSGDYYAYEYFRGGGAVRASISHYNTAAEVDRLLELLG
jgi:selenocysteine lyase/cysteine desulfurase